MLEARGQFAERKTGRRKNGMDSWKEFFVETLKTKWSLIEKFCGFWGPILLKIGVSNGLERY